MHRLIYEFLDLDYKRFFVLAQRIFQILYNHDYRIPENWSLDSEISICDNL